VHQNVGVRNVIKTVRSGESKEKKEEAKNERKKHKPNEKASLKN